MLAEVAQLFVLLRINPYRSVWKKLAIVINDLIYLSILLLLTVNEFQINRYKDCSVQQQGTETDKAKLAIAYKNVAQSTFYLVLGYVLLNLLWAALVVAGYLRKRVREFRSRIMGHSKSARPGLREADDLLFLAHPTNSTNSIDFSPTRSFQNAIITGDIN